MAEDCPSAVFGYSEWQDLPKFRYFGVILEVWQFCNAHLVIDKILHLKLCYLARAELL